MAHVCTTTTVEPSRRSSIGAALLRARSPPFVKLRPTPKRVAAQRMRRSGWGWRWNSVDTSPRAEGADSSSIKDTSTPDEDQAWDNWFKTAKQERLMDRWLASKPSTQNKVTPTQTTRGHNPWGPTKITPVHHLTSWANQVQGCMPMVRGSLEETAAAPTYGAAAFATHFLEKHTKLNQDEASKKRRKSPNRSRPSQQRHQERFSANFAPDSDEIANERNRPAPAANSFEDWIINQSDPRTWAWALIPGHGRTCWHDYHCLETIIYGSLEKSGLRQKI